LETEQCCIDEVIKSSNNVDLLRKICSIAFTSFQQTPTSALWILNCIFL